jgi:hypothetical protein
VKIDDVMPGGFIDFAMLVRAFLAIRTGIALGEIDEMLTGAEL